MFLQKIRNLSHTLSFRLTLWYAAIFMLSTLLLLSFFYYYIASQIIEDTDCSLGEEVTEFRSLLNKSGLESVKKYIAIEAESEVEDTFFRLISPDDREIVLATNFALNGTQPLEQFVPLSRKKAGNVFATINIPGYPNPLRIVSGGIGQGLILQAGETLAGNEKMRSFFKRFLLLVVFPSLVMSMIIGWFLARRALSGVEKVALTAEKIAQGDYNQRVRLEHSTLEVENLAGTFNNMLDRIQELVKGLKEVTDNIAHDLRSPLARIRGQAEMTVIRKDSLTDYRAMAANTIEECDNLIDMINTMLDITEVETGVGNNEREPVAMSELIRFAGDLFKPIAEEKQVTLTSVLPDKEVYLHGDRHKFQRLVTNLIENGIKYNRPGGVVTVTLEERDRTLQILFKDTGIGISEEALSKIFDRFYRCDASRSEPGLGLGLSLAKAIVQASGGDIRVKSTVNQGSLFIVRLPL